MSDVTIPNAARDWAKEHVKTYLEDPDKGHIWDASFAGGKKDAHCLLLTARGRKSGKMLTLPLIYGKFDDGYVVIGSKGGDPNHPQWYKNLLADPHCQVQVGHDRFNAEAETVEDERRVAFWNGLVEEHPPYTEYQEKAGARKIPVVLLKRA